MITLPHLTEIYIFKIHVVEDTGVFCDDSMLFCATNCCVLILSMLRTMSVSHLTLLLFTSNFRPQFHFSLEICWLRCNSLKKRDILVRAKPRKWAIFDILESTLLAPIIASHSKSLKSLVLHMNRQNGMFTSELLYVAERGCIDVTMRYLIDFLCNVL